MMKIVFCQNFYRIFESIADVFMTISIKSSFFKTVLRQFSIDFFFNIFVFMKKKFLFLILILLKL